MSVRGLLKIFFLSIIVVYGDFCRSQSSYQFEITKTVVGCQKASASLIITGTAPNDTVHITWSNGQTGVSTISDLDEGDYQVNINIPHKLDTNFFFKIEKEMCKVSVTTFFTPNGDNYNDYLNVSNVENYPNFELEIYNKWGQKVHSQKSKFTPWDGTWAGIKVPDGTYYYLFFYDQSNKNKVLKGDVTVLR